MKKTLLKIRLICLSKQSIILIFVSFLNILNYAQSTHPPIKCEGEIPLEFIKLSSVKYREDLTKIDKSASKQVKKTSKDFYLESNFVITELLQSGIVTFNDPVSLYMNEVKNHILSHDKTLQQKIRIYLVKSEIPNAFTTEDGIVFVTVGLFSRLSNESQLAFILCHEFIHYINHHVMNGYIESANIDENSEKLTLNDKLLAKSNFSIEQEKNADKEGLNLFLKSNYSIHEAKKVFDLLELSHPPIDLNTLDLSKIHLNDTCNLKLSPNNLLLKVKENQEEINKNKSKFSTHPDLVERRELFIKEISEEKDIERNDFLVSVEKFHQSKQLCIEEICRLFLINDNPVSCFFAVQGITDKNLFSEILAKTFYHYSLIKLNNSTKNNDNYFTNIDLVTIEEILNKSNRSKFILKSMKEIYDSPLKEGKRFYHIENIIKNNTTFNITGIESIYTDKNIELKLVDSINSCNNFNFNYYSTNIEWIKKINNDKNIDSIKMIKTDKSIIVLDPFYYRLQAFNKNKNIVRFQASESGLMKFNNQISKCFNSLEINSILISPINMKTSDVNLFNDMAILRNYINEKSKNSNDFFVSVDDEIIEEIYLKYNAQGVMLVGEISVQTHKKKWPLIIGSILLWPTIPFGLAYALSPNYESFNVINYFDLENNKSTEIVHHYSQNDSNATVIASLYYNISKLIKD